LYKFHNKKHRQYNAEWQRNRHDARRTGEGLIECQICGKRYYQVGSHVVQTHGYNSAREYREVFGFDVKRGQLEENLRKVKSKQVFDNGTYKNLKKGKVYWFKKGDRTAGRYTRSYETLARLTQHIKRISNAKIQNRTKLP